MKPEPNEIIRNFLDRIKSILVEVQKKNLREAHRLYNKLEDDFYKYEFYLNKDHLFLFVHAGIASRNPKAVDMVRLTEELGEFIFKTKNN